MKIAEQNNSVNGITKHHVFLVIAMFTFFANDSSANLLINGSFESPNITGGNVYLEPVGWTGTGGYLESTTSIIDPPPLPYPDGSQAFGVGGDGTSISQNFALITPSKLLLTYWDAHETGSPFEALDSWATITDLALSTIIAISPHFSANTNDTWKLNSWDIGNLGLGNYQLSLTIGGLEVIDDVRLETVPEPGTIYLFGVSALLLLKGRRLR